MNRWNYSISVAVLVAIAGLTNWALSRPAFFVVGLSGAALLALLAALFTSLWIGQITDFKALNGAKFSVLNRMAHNVVFLTGEPGQLMRSYRPFEREWEELSAAKALTEVRATRIVSLALNSSNAEYYVPKAIRAMFALVFVAVALIAVMNWDSVQTSARCLTSGVGNAECQ